MTGLRIEVRAVLVTALTLTLLYLFFRNANLSAVLAVLRETRPGLLASALSAIFTMYAVRAQRWRFLLAPLGGATLGQTFRTTVIGFAASAILPARAGEVLRPYLLARQAQLPLSAVLATVLL